MARCFLVTIACALIAGCSSSGNVRVGLSGNTGGVAPGTASAGASLTAQIASATVAGTLITVGMLAAAWHGAEADRLAGRYGSEFAPNAPLPPLDGSRRVNEQDCTRPIEDGGANLKCR
jgi:hypothetical protein